MKFHKDPAADISLKYQSLSELGLVIGLLLFILAFLAFKQFSAEVREVVVKQQVMEVEQVQQTVQQKTQPRPSRPTFTVADEDEQIAQDEEFEFDEEEDWTMAPPPPPPRQDAEEEIVDFFAIENPPEMQGGTAALYKLVKYPETAIRAGVAGLAQIQFIVGPDGTTRDFVIMAERPEGLGFGQAAIDALAQIRFTPGKQRDRFVAVRMSQVIKFETQN